MKIHCRECTILYVPRVGDDGFCDDRCRSYYIRTKQKMKRKDGRLWNATRGYVKKAPPILTCNGCGCRFPAKRYKIQSYCGLSCSGKANNSKRNKTSNERA